MDKDLLSQLDYWEQRIGLVAGFVLIALLGIISYASANEFAWILFYLIPISWISWTSGRDLGIVAATISISIIVLNYIIRNDFTGSLPTRLLCCIQEFLFFIAVAYLVSALKRSIQNERSISNTDALTGLANRRMFLAVLQLELNKFERDNNPFTVVYIDLDNFKYVNDTFGHTDGDVLLKAIAEEFKMNLRKADLVARLSGDEFAFLLPSTERKGAEYVLEKLHKNITTRLKRTKFPVTLSCGAVTFSISPKSIEKIISVVDALMYSVKNNGKNSIKFQSYTSESCKE